MSRISDAFQRLRSENRRAFIPYITAGDPDLRLTRELVFEMEMAGAKIIELGIPFSDPLADGPTIQEASQKALRAGTTLEKILSTVEEIRRASDVPIALMTYYNPIFRVGISNFLQQAVDAGVDGIIVPDLPPEEGEELRRTAERIGIDTIFLLAPTSTAERIRLVAEASTGFIYCVSVTGVTGAREKLSGQVRELVARVRRHTNKPLGVGFGISTPDQAAEVARWADGVIVGSAIIKVIRKYEGTPELVPRVGEFVKSLVAAMGNIQTEARG
ncbi:MAG TPA: tryptophan synthase subunit alpha [Candidatus Latescibacteria bacterium]|nr:tryptophan synthase subunit alpha [Candidatus Latescibacterota bacterium]